MQIGHWASSPFCPNMQWQSLNFCLKPLPLEKYRQLFHLAWNSINVSVCKARDQNMCFRGAMTGVERNAKCHTSSRLSLKTEPFWNLPLLYFLECMHQVSWTEKMKVTSSTSQILSRYMHPGCGCRVYTLLCPAMDGCNLGPHQSGSVSALCGSVCGLGLGRGTVTQGLI